MNAKIDLAATLLGRRMMFEGNARQRSAPQTAAGLSVSTAWLGALGLSCLSLACAGTSEERVVAIARLLEEARSFEAERYAPDAFARAEGLLSRARAELAAHRDKPRFTSRRHARALLAQSEAAASLARAEATAALVRARQQAYRELTAAHAAFDRASEAYWRSPRGKDTRSDLERMRADLDALLRSLHEAELALEKGDFLNARSLAAAVSRQAGDVAAIIDRATAFRIGGLGSGAATHPRAARPEPPA